MINLLPPGEKQKLLMRDKQKLAMILGIMSTISLICLALIFLSIKFYVLAEADYQKGILSQAEQKTKTVEFLDFNNTIKKYNAVLSQLGFFYKKEVYFNSAMTTVTEIVRPEGLYFDNFSLIRDAKGIIKMKISGNSDTREDLLIFQKNIENEKRIINPSFSPESWTSPKNVNFSLSLEINQNAE